MAALGCPGNMAAVVGAMEPIEEYVQVMVGEDGDPSQVVVLQGEGGELLRPVQELSPELLQSISPTDTVYYVQPDGSLVPGGRLGEVQTGGHLVSGGVEAAHLVSGGVEAAHLVSGGVEAAHLVSGGVEAAHLVSGGVEAAHLVSGGVEAAHLVSGGVEAAHLVSGGVEAAHLVSGGVEAAHLVSGGVEAAHLVSGGVEAAHLVSGGHGMEAAHMVNEVEAAHQVTGGQGMEAAHLVTAEVEAAHLVSGGVEAAHMVTGGHVDEVAQLVTGGHGVEAAHQVTGGYVDEAAHQVTGGYVDEAAHQVTGGPGDVAEDSEGQGMEAAVNLVTRVEEAVHPGLILLSGEHPGVNLVTEDHMLEVVESEMSLVNGGQIEESVQNGGQEDDPVEEDMVTALNLTKETARRTQETASPEGTVHNQSLPAVSSRLPAYTAGVTMLKDAAQQLKSVAHQVTLREAESLPRVLTHKELKSIHIQVPSLQTKKSAEPVVLNLSTVHLKNASPSLLGAQVVQIKSLSESRPPLVVNSSSLDSPVQIFVRQAQLSARNPGTPDPNNNRSYVAHPQNGAHVTSDHGQKKGHKRKKAIKVKTRSGRISRPPKHKAKDYKFLKVGDMIQGSTSDSEDFSEQSSEEEEKGVKEKAPCDLPLYTVKNSLFQCQTCEKSYMGKGGLSRHYRLYPSHGQMEPPFVSDDKKNGESGVGHVVPSVPKKPTPRPRKRLLEDPLNPDNSSLPNLAKDGLEFASPTCQGRQQVTGRRFGYPRKVLAKAPSEQNALTAKELIQQCEDADIKEHVAPCLSARLSVYDFLVVKVKQDHPDAPLFPHLYKELENLHNRVRILAQEYLSNGGAGKTLEVADCKVAASLGISAERIHVFSPDISSIKEEKIQSADKCSGEELTPPAKRLKVDDQESLSPTKDVTTGGAPDLKEEEQRTDPASAADWPCKNDTSSNDTINCTEQVLEISHPNVLEEEAENLHTGAHLESAPCEESLMETSPALIGASNCAQISSELPEERSGDAIQTRVVQGDTDSEEVLPGNHAGQPPCPQPCAADSTLPSEAPPTLSDKTCSEGFQGVDTFVSREIIASDQCTQAFDFHHGQDLVFVHSSEEGAMTDEAVVIYDCAETLADAHMDTEVGLVEMSQI
ncbi:zinc finger protein 839 [Hyla sarda]|uniref:zinc finger protein 839 n=1 Tax=Hyla sarda TaxID=327740 RepID=UPI0024C423A6|nr:zinc finger protein 839 [Hyla sarda]